MIWAALGAARSRADLCFSPHSARRGLVSPTSAAAFRGPRSAPQPPPDAPRWPLLRRKNLAATIGRFLSQSEGVPERLFVTGARGAGAGTAVQAAVANAAAAQDGGGSPTQSPVVVVADLSTEEATSDPLGTFRSALQRQAAEQLQSASAAHLLPAVSEVVRQYPNAAEALSRATEAVGTRAGLPGALPRGTEVPGCQEALATHRDDAPSLTVAVSEAMAAASARGRGQTVTAVHAAMALLSEAGMAVSGAQRASEYLLSATRALSGGRDIVIVLVRADVLSRTTSVHPGHTLLRMVDDFIAGAHDISPRGSVRLLVQSCDGVAAARASETGAEVLTVEGWSEEMARAVVVPRYISGDDEAGWRGLWATVGGHPLHLRRFAELLVQERQQLAHKSFQERMEQSQTEAMRRLRPEKSPDAEEATRVAEQQHEDDSFRADARGSVGAVEGLLRRLPEALREDVDMFEEQLAAFVRHPLLGHLGGSESAVGRTVILIGAIRRYCECTHVPIGGSFSELADPVLIALLDVGILVPNWPISGPCLVPANLLTRTWLQAWAEAQSTELPLKEAAKLWRSHAVEAQSPAPAFGAADSFPSKSTVPARDPASTRATA